MSTRRPRYRYVAFRVEGPRPFSREEVLRALHGLADPLWLVDFAGSTGLARTTNTERDATVRALTGLHSLSGEAVRVTTLGTSGTIRRATEKYLPSGAKNRPRRKKPYK